jgi:hypothetical protein
MSNPIAFGVSAARASSADPTAPPAGPERTLQAPDRAASAADAVPPDERMTSGSGRLFSRQASATLVRYRPRRGER